jgi:threonine synthase
LTAPTYRCSTCGARPEIVPSRFRCDCGSPLDLDFEAGPVDPRALARRPESIWRWHEALPLADRLPRVTLGEGVAPIVADALGGIPVQLALEYVTATGSYKDRGAALLVALASWLGVEELVDDTSGNAGIALAAHAAHAGLRARLFVPEDAPEAKPAIARRFGAEIVRVPGPREAAAVAALKEAEAGAFYASHAWNPFFVHGVKTLAYAIAEANAWRAPGAIVVPCGNGGLVLGLDLGFREMRRHGLVDRRPALIAVQAEACAPIAAAFASGASSVAPVKPLPTSADGIRVAAPPRGDAVLATVRGSGGEVLAVAEAAIDAALGSLWRGGYAVEPTSAAAAAAVLRDGTRLRDAHGDLVVVLTGSGLKS